MRTAKSCQRVEVSFSGHKGHTCCGRARVKMRLKNLYLYFRAIPKTFIFNFRYFPLKTAIKFPVLVSHRVLLMDLGGQVIIHNQKTFSIRIGFGEVGIFDQSRSRSIWQVTGIVEFKGAANIGHGSKISVHGNLILGDNFCITAESSIVANDKITIGDDVLFSWDALLMDSDLHEIFDEQGRHTNAPKPINIGNHVWIGCRTTILKGTSIPDGCIVAAGSVMRGQFSEPKAAIGGNPAKIIKQNISWK